MRHPLPRDDHSRQRKQKGPGEGVRYVEGAQLVCLKNGEKARVTGDDFPFEWIPVSPARELNY